MPKPGWHGTNNGPEPPCYDRKTKTDCPRRCGGCQVDCPDWKDYCEERQKVYDKRLSDFHANSIISENSYDAHMKRVKKEQRMKRYYR
jgi:hypothetical protein